MEDENQTPNQVDEVSTNEQNTGGINENELNSMYEELGVKARVTNGSVKRGSKTSNSRDKKTKSEGIRVSRGQGESEDGSKNSSVGDSDRSNGDNTNSSSKEDSKEDGKVSDSTKKTSSKVQDAKSKTKSDSDQDTGEETQSADNGVGQDDNKSEDEKSQKTNREEKRNPEIERRFQKIISESKSKDNRIAELEQQLSQYIQEHQARQLNEEDPVYTKESFLTVRDNEGNVIQLSPEEAELEYYRWKEGYDQRQVQRQQLQAEQMRRQQEIDERERQMIESSVNAYDELVAMVDEFPELSENSDSFDPDLAKTVMPLIKNSIEYMPGTENTANPVIIGFKVNPRDILSAIKTVREAKRELPLTGLNDNVSIGSNISYKTPRSSDPMARQANELYEYLGIKKRY